MADFQPIQQSKTGESHTNAKKRLGKYAQPGTEVERLTTEAATARTLAERRRKLDELRTLVNHAEAEASRAVTHHDELFHRFIDDVGPRLAADLTDGKPCPVCGSSHHPAPATGGWRTAEEPLMEG